MAERKININTADERELKGVKGVGNSLAQKIIAYREEHGPLQGSEDLRNIVGEGKTYDRLKGLFAFERGERVGISGSEREFMVEATLGNLLEIRMGELAEEKGGSKEVKNYGKMLQRDHYNMLEELQALADENDIDLPGELDEKHKDIVDKISGFSAEEFDCRFLETMLEEHEEDIRQFSAQADEAQDPDVQSLASKTVPKLEKHLDKAKQIMKKLD